MVEKLYEKDVIFKQKFYDAKSAHYETATSGRHRSATMVFAEALNKLIYDAGFLFA